LQMSGFATPAGRRVLMPLTVFQASQAKTFQPESRVNDIYLHYPYEEIDKITFHVPDGYKIESVPPNSATPKSPIEYSISAAPQGSTVTVTRELHVNGIFYQVKYYPTIRAIFSKVKTLDENQIVLQPVEAALSN
jgi:hypothetical protein